MNTYVVVFDTNILFSGLGWRGSPFRCLELARERQVISVTCQEILAELEEKLRLKQNMSVTEAAQDVAQVLSFSRLVTINNTLNVVADDPDDDMVLECAVVGGASHIVSGDRRFSCRRRYANAVALSAKHTLRERYRHLLSLGSYQDIAIVSAANFLALVSHA